MRKTALLLSLLLATACGTDDLNDARYAPGRPLTISLDTIGVFAGERETSPLDSDYVIWRGDTMSGDQVTFRLYAPGGHLASHYDLYENLDSAVTLVLGGPDGDTVEASYMEVHSEKEFVLVMNGAEIAGRISEDGASRRSDRQADGFIVEETPTHVRWRR